MKKYNKRFRYFNYVFNISVELNFEAERRMGGRVSHQIIINDMESTNYYDKFKCISDDLEKAIEDGISRAQKYVDERESGKVTTEEESFLISKGFAPQV